MSNTLILINARAARLKAKNKNLKHTDAISRASKELKREGKIGGTKTKTASRKKKVATKKKSRPVKKRVAKGGKGLKKNNVRYQTGESNKPADKRRTAKAPGERRSKSGNYYTENRANRSDVPGRLTGIGSNLVSMRDRLERDIVSVSSTIERTKADKTLPKTFRAVKLKQLNNIRASNIKSLNDTNRLIRQQIK